MNTHRYQRIRHNEISIEDRQFCTLNATSLVATNISLSLEPSRPFAKQFHAHVQLNEHVIEISSFPLPNINVDHADRGELHPELVAVARARSSAATRPHHVAPDCAEIKAIYTRARGRERHRFSTCVEPTRRIRHAT